MANIDCNACQELRDRAPDFVVNGLTDRVCTSLKNNTGLNPSNSSTNCDDLHDANDCLVGRMAQEVEAYEVCDWKTYMKKFVTNVYTVLKGVICWLCGIQEQVDSIENMCDSIDNILNLIQGGKPRNHFGEWTDYFKSHATFDSRFSWDYFLPTFRAQIDDGAGCDSSKRLGRYLMDWDYNNDIYPDVFSWQISDDVAVNDVIATIPMSAVVPDGMSENRWKSLLRTTTLWQWGTINRDTFLFIGTRGYTIINGQVFNPDLQQYGENTMVVTIGALIGPSTQGGFNGSLGGDIRSYTTS